MLAHHHKGSSAPGAPSTAAGDAGTASGRPLRGAGGTRIDDREKPDPRLVRIGRPDYLGEGDEFNQGLFAARDIPARTRVVEFEKPVHRKSEDVEAEGYPNSTGVNVGNKYIWDAGFRHAAGTEFDSRLPESPTQHTPLWYYINHAPERPHNPLYAANLEAHPGNAPGDEAPPVYFVSRRKIAAGEELLFQYDANAFQLWNQKADERIAAEKARVAAGGGPSHGGGGDTTGPVRKRPPRVRTLAELRASTCRWGPYYGR